MKTWIEYRIDEMNELGNYWKYDNHRAYAMRAEWFMSDRFARFAWWDEGAEVDTYYE